MMNKAAFFDIDGTIWDMNTNIPDSTREALRLLKENGVYTFICSGRAPAFLGNPKLHELGFDGIVAGCGTYVLFHGEELLCHFIEPKLVKKTVDILRAHGLGVLLEGKNFQYMDEKVKEDRYYPFLKKELGDKLVLLDDYDMAWEANKFTAMLAGDQWQDALEELKQWYHIIIQDGVVCEGVPLGFSKASGIQFICEKLNVARENVYAFGDGPNDIEMIEYAGCGIAMGNGRDVVKDIADYVTDRLDEDGIYNACRHFGLI